MANRILVADDDRAIREAVARALELEGYEVLTAADGVAALEAVAAQRPDAVVLDVMMPTLDGLGVCRALRNRGDQTPILILTARTEVSDRVAGLDAGALEFGARRQVPSNLLQERLCYGHFVHDRTSQITTAAGLYGCIQVCKIRM